MSSVRERWQHRHWLRPHKPGEPPLDGWSIIHLLSGMGLGVILRADWFWFALLILVAYEGFEALLRRVKPRGGKGVFEYESWSNIGYDVLFGAIGWLFAQGLPALPVPWFA